MSPLWPLGVDIVESKKAAAFYRRHRGRLADLFHPSEIDFFRRSGRPSQAFATVFAAKEAVFKSLGVPWMGSSGFRDIRILPGKDFSVRLSGGLKKKFRGAAAFKVSITKTRRHVVALCRPASFGPCAGT